MRKAVLFGLATLFMAMSFGCKSKATDAQLEEMCKHLLDISGDTRGTVEEEAVQRVEEEYAQKEKNLKEEMARDLKGMDDVLVQKLSDIEAGREEEPAATEEEEEGEEVKKGDKGKTPAKEEKKEEVPKEEKIKAANEDIAKKKKEITDQFNNLIEKLGPQKGFAVRDAKKYVAKRQKHAEETLKRCIDDVKTRKITVERYQCRMKTTTRDEYFACPE